MTLPSDISGILGPLFSQLTSTTVLNGVTISNYGWTSTDVNAAEAFIEESPLFVAQLAAMQQA
jgi:ubiquinone biosynthesis protein UbiJ